MKPEACCDANPERSETNCNLLKTYGDGRMEGNPYRHTTTLGRPCASGDVGQEQKGDLNRGYPLHTDPVSVTILHP